MVLLKHGFGEDSREILKEIHPEYSEGLMLKLKLQYFGYLMQRANSLEKTLMLGKIEGRRRRGRQRMICWMASPTQQSWVWASSGRWWRTGKLGVLQSMGSQRVQHDWVTEQQQQFHIQWVLVVCRFLRSWSISSKLFSVLFWILVIWTFSFFFFSFVNGCQFYWSFQRNSFLFHWFSALFSYF